MGSEGDAWGASAILYRALRESLTEKMTFKKILGGNEGARHCIFGR